MKPYNHIGITYLIPHGSHHVWRGNLATWKPRIQGEENNRQYIEQANVCFSSHWWTKLTFILVDIALSINQVIRLCHLLENFGYSVSKMWIYYTQLRLLGISTTVTIKIDSTLVNKSKAIKLIIWTRSWAPADPALGLTRLKNYVRILTQTLYIGLVA